MVIRTDICSFSEFRIYPGRGQKFVARDGKVSVFLSKKAKSLSLRKIKSQRITWTTAWRRANKKIKAENEKNKKKRRVVKIERGIVGLPLDQLKKVREQKPEERQARAEEALREITARRKKLIDDKKKTQKDRKVDHGQKKAAEK